MNISKYSTLREITLSLWSTVATSHDTKINYLQFLLPVSARNRTAISKSFAIEVMHTVSLDRLGDFLVQAQASQLLVESW